MDLNLIQCYISVNQIIFQAKSTDPSTWQNLHTWLPQLHERLSCKVCHKLIDLLNPYLDGYACSTCVNHQITENTLSIIIECYKKLCAYIHSTPVYKVMCTRVEDKQLVELLTEVNNPCPSVNGYSGLIKGLVNKQKTEKVDNEDKTLISSSNVQSSIEDQTLTNNISLEILDEQPQNHKIQDISEFNNNPKKKKNERRWGCRCGNTAKNSSLKLTCTGQRCRCYAVQKPCEECSCKGCKNPIQKRSNNDDNLEIDQIRRKPVTLDLISSQINSEPAFSSYTMHDMLQLPSHSQNYDEDETEVTLGHVNSLFHSP